MKKTYLLLCLLYLFFNNLSNLSAQIVVPKGWEKEKTVRKAIANGAYDYNGTGIPWREDSNRVKILFDSLGVNMIFSYSNIDASRSGLGTNRKGYIAQGHYKDSPYDLGWVGDRLKQRIYYPSPDRIGFWFDPGYRWRYIDSAHYSWHNNVVDSNDVSPYALFDSDRTLVKSKYFTKMNNLGGDSLLIGNEGRVILGYNDQRNATPMLMAPSVYPFGQSSPRGFSARFEFNIDTSNIITDSTALPVDDIPLMRIQILYKRGEDLNDSGWNVLPFVPFKTDSTDFVHHGWLKLIDQTITKASYRALDDDWRVPDTLQNGLSSHSWNFKQLQILLNNLPSYAKITKSTNLKSDFSTGSNRPPLATTENPDTFVSIDSSDGQYLWRSPETSPKKTGLFEIRILSTYRAPLHIRCMTWQDTLVDKFLYRKRFKDLLTGKDTTHSLNPNGSFGGLDDSVQKVVNDMADSVKKSGCIIREILINDTWSEFAPNSASGIAYIDYMTSKRGINTHIREQEAGDWSSAFRRNRLGYDGIPPAVFENQTAYFYSQRYKSGRWIRPEISDVFPGDYIPSSALGTGAWLSSSLDTMAGLIIGRPGDSTDLTKAYRAYTETEEIQSTCYNLRQSSYASLHHSKAKKMAVESSPQTWGLIHTDAFPDTGYSRQFPDDVSIDWTGDTVRFYSFAISSYNQRPTTPEENNAFYYISLANGCGSFNVAQCLDGGGNPGGGSATEFGFSIRHDGYWDPAYIDYSYNWGHRRTWWGENAWLSPNHNVVDSVLPAYYLGFSNQFRASARVIGRINQIYDTVGGNNYPLKRMTWLDAYSTHQALSNSVSKSDTGILNQAFLKCFRTTQVKLWEKGTHGEYLDSLNGTNLVSDSARRTYVEVGLFIDSTSPISKNYAALVVNTRLYPDHKTGDDSAYYCKDLSTQDQPHSLFGDAAVRKVWFRIDTSKMDPFSRANYYIVHDLWHQDSTWLVKNDSSFAIYLKPGDAKFLYIEKGISIQVAKTATVSSPEDFQFNNGRRVCERMNGTRTVETYTRGNKLYVSNASRGKSIPGYNERSDGDNIATGNEICIDTSSICYRPSICVGRDDQSVAIAYWKVPNQLWVAYQRHPDSGWHKAQNFAYSCIDTSSDKSFVTPVCTPIDDTMWALAAGYRRDPSDLSHFVSGIVGARFFYDTTDLAPHVSFKSDPFTYLFQDRTIDTSVVSQSYFPTIASRPMALSMYPIRLAWQKGQAGNSLIMSERISWDANTVGTLIIEPAKIISTGLPSNCYNAHPNISMCGIQDPWHGLKSIDSSINVYVTWESKLFGKLNTNFKYFPVLRNYTQRMSQVNGAWNRTFQVFQPDTSADDNTHSFRYPLVSANNRIGGKVFNNDPRKATPAYHDFLRLVWGNLSKSIQFEHWENGWIQGKLKEAGRYPSIGHTTDTMIHWTNSKTVPLSTVFVGEQTYLSENQIRITNGWSPWIDTVIPKTAKKIFLIDSNANNPCAFSPPMNISIDPHISLVHNGTGVNQPIRWCQIDPCDASILSESWDVAPANSVEVHTDSTTIQGGDSLNVPRLFEITDTALIKNALGNSSDTLAFDLVLRRSSDSSIVATIEHSYISKYNMSYPNHGLDSSIAKYKYPSGSPGFTGFISAELKRAQVDSLVSYIIEADDRDTVLPSESFKKSANQFHQLSSKLKVDVVPNPFSKSTIIKINSVEGSMTSIEVFDGLGKKVANLFNGAFPAAPMEVRFESAMLSTGSYYIRVVSGNDILTRQIELIK